MCDNKNRERKFTLKYDHAFKCLRFLGEYRSLARFCGMRAGNGA